MLSHHTVRKILRQIFKLSPAYKPFQLTILIVINTLLVAVGGTFAALGGTVARTHWDKGMLADFRMDVNKEIADLSSDLSKLLLSHGELRNNLQMINEALKKT